ncbi:hypothetical protein POM88_002814 [Heracleum sosnowskyi]|uniref:Uncharacterized protein n=1 Tax=Heracleum sosnowskyi TaxID=360622 RepID=A0AAD8JFE1_9APIA|nr:hypothetical protein POM88_002814 [Heracleum sosnowskyi]
MASWEPSATTETEVPLRRGVLHPLGVSFLTIMQKGCTKAQDSGGRTGSTTRRIARLIAPALPFMYAMQYELLVVLAFIDDHIRVFANFFKNRYPPSTYLFRKIERLVDIVETLPDNLDDTMSNFPVIIQRIPFLDSALTTLISSINLLLSIFTHWRISYYTREKDIMVDVSCDSFSDDSDILVQLNTDHFKEVREAKTVGMRASYKDIFERGKREVFARKRESAADQDLLESYYSTEEALEGDGTGSDDNIVTEDPIMELFDTSWHMNPAKASSLPAGSFTFA